MGAVALLTVADLQIFEPDIEPTKAEAMIASAAAMAVRVAPCLANEAALDPLAAEAAKTVMRAAVLRWNAQGSRQVSQRQQSAGPFMLGETITTGERAGGGLFWPSEIAELAGICRGGPASPRAFAVDTTPSGPVDGVRPWRPWSEVGWTAW